MNHLVVRLVIGFGGLAQALKIEISVFFVVETNNSENLFKLKSYTQ